MSVFWMEIYCEEIPARMQPQAQEQMKVRLQDLLEQQFNGYPKDSVKTFITPMRMIAVAKNVPAVTEAISEELRGPKGDAPEQAAGDCANERMVEVTFTPNGVCPNFLG